MNIIYYLAPDNLIYGNKIFELNIMMKHLFVAICLMACTLFQASAQKVKPVEYGGGVSLLEVVDQKALIVKLRVVGYGKKDAQAQEDAEVRAIRAVMYAGVDNIRPLLVESQAEAKFGAFLNSFFDSKQYKDYISMVEPAGGLTKVKGLKVKKQPYDIRVNVGALERFLLQNGVKKRMGF